jgi:uncharacterized protein YfaS (alpha-2-macroglobulin family)
LGDAEVEALLRGLGAEAKRAAADDVGRPLYVTGSIELQVNRDRKRLTVAVHPDQATHQPGESMTVQVDVREPNGAGADAEVTLMAVDEAVLSLLAYQTPDVLPLLVAPAYTVTSAESVANTLLRRASPPATQALGGGVRTRSGGGPGRMAPEAAMAPAAAAELSVADGSARNKSGPSGPTAARTLFATTAHYLASATTQDGKVTSTFKLPDNLTRFRLMAIAVGRGDHAGSGEDHVTVRKPLLLRPALPRVASFGDRFEASVVVHNETGAAGEVVVGMRAAGLSLRGEAIQRYRLANGEAREVTFPVTADVASGKARVQFAAMTDGGKIGRAHV